MRYQTVKEHVAIPSNRNRLYDRARLTGRAVFRDFVLEMIRRINAEPSFKALPQRWVIERTFGWMTRWQRLVRNNEHHIGVSIAGIHVTAGVILLHRSIHS